MANQNPPSRQNLRKHSKQKKVNLILNISIAVVFLLIVVVGWSIISSQKDVNETSGNKHDSQKIEKVEDKGTAKKDNTNNATTDKEPKTKEDSEEQKDDESSTEEEVETVESDDPNVIEAKINNNWQPIGTSQTGEHTTKYDKGTTDRQEMEKALSYATGVSTDNMIVWWLENGGTPNKNVIGTISTKDSTKIYRVYLEWVDGEGWKPTKLEQLKENDKR
ncbi:YrrS family protein [Bacillus andreraoultii]|uniref:YrrS family protein n=1 Tax=Bacillus andreraoultii TaxID=1499685 RepID=UPI0005AA976A|nr:YrrS family protein [Bacillus andreraoultii]